jgi:very-short-patch-repair endonuclease
MHFQRQLGQTKRARNLRQQVNPSEASMWTVLKNRQLGGYKFVRQLPIGPFYADFACRQFKLVVEIDGSQHVENEYDRRRDQCLAHLGYAVLRIPSGLVLKKRSDVCDTILAVLEGRIAKDVDTIDMKFTLPSPASLRSASSPVNGRGEKSSLLPRAGERGLRTARDG